MKQLKFHLFGQVLVLTHGHQHVLHVGHVQGCSEHVCWSRITQLFGSH